LSCDIFPYSTLVIKGKEVWGKGQRTKAIGVGRKKKKEFSQELPREFTAKLLYMS